MEATARKPGNVHPQASFSDLCYRDFVLSANACAEPLSLACVHGVGRAVFDAVVATREQVQTNTNLGIILLLAPLAAVPDEQQLIRGIGHVLRSLNAADTRHVYAAIRHAHPGGMGKVDKGDIEAAPPDDLLWAMEQSADRDWIARQYVTDFRDVLETGVDLIVAWRPEADWETRVIRLALELLSRWPDTLIQRKCGQGIAEEASRLAGEILQHGWPDRPDSVAMLTHFDRWLRADGHRRNPGTTADAVAAILFAALRDGLADFPDWTMTAASPG